jgi:S-adenosylmethionine hydrolase
LPRPEGAPVTFDGRDVFAPAGARLWAGAPLRSLGAAIDPATLATLPPPRCRVGTATLDAEVLWVDRFGNVQLAATAADGAAAGLSGEVEVRVADKTMPARRVDTFGELAPGELGLLVDGNGHLAVACNREAAATVLGVTAGDDVAVTAGRAP